jgi:hypothetical protein
VTTIVIHTAEGARTIQELGNYFANPASEVSSHVGIDDQDGVVGEYVQRTGKAWTASNANPYSIQAELCAFAEWDAAEWDRHPSMLANTAAWIAEEAAYFGIPLDLLSDAAAQNPNTPGVCQHADLGAMGGGHWDCGPNFPINDVLDMAAGRGPKPTPRRKADDDMPYYLFCPSEGGDGRWWITNMRTDSRPCDSLDDALNTDYFLRSGPPNGAGVDGLVCNRKADGSVAGPIAVDSGWLRQVTSHAAAEP